MSPVAKVVAYSILIFWTLFVLFPLYWVVITSFKNGQLVNEGPITSRLSTFTPTLDGWRRQFVDDASKVFPAFINSVIIAVAANRALYDRWLDGGLCAGAHPVQAEVRQHHAVCTDDAAVADFRQLRPVLLRGIGIEAPRWVFDWKLASAVALAMFFLLVRAVGKGFKRHLGNGDILFWIISQRILPPIVV